MKAVKVRRRVRGRTRISAKNQVTLPVEALRRAGLGAGDEVKVSAGGPGMLRVVRADDPVKRWAGVFTGVYPKGYLARLRREWDA